MSYLPIARKYRPQSFAEVVGQDSVVKTLSNAITLDRLHHAYLFCGIRGVGKTSLARILAKSLNCETGPTVAPCGTCSTCREIAQGISLDVIEIDGASNTGVDDIRSLKEQVHYLPQKGRYKLYIIDEVHMLSTSAFNALLKVLEEPPPQVIFCFATTELHKIPLTVLSRCQRFELRRIGFLELVAHLRHVCGSEQVDCDDEAISRIARLADGSLRDGLSILDQAIGMTQGKITREFLDEWLGFSNRELLRGLLEAVLASDTAEILRILQGFHGGSLEPERALGEFLEMLHTLIVVKSGAKRAELELLSDDDYSFFSRLAKDSSIEQLDWLFVMGSRGLSDLALTPLAAYSLDVLFLRLARAGQLRDLVLGLSTQPPASLTSLSPKTPSRTVPPASPKSQPPSVASQGPSQVAAAVGPVGPAVAFDAAGWQGFVEGLQKKEPQLGALVSQFKWRVDVAVGGVCLYADPSSLYGSLIKDKLSRLETLAQECFKKSIRLELVSPTEDKGGTQTAMESVKMIQDEAVKARHEEATAQARGHHLVKALTDIFGGTLQQVKPLSD